MKLPVTILLSLAVPQSLHAMHEASEALCIAYAELEQARKSQKQPELTLHQRICHAFEQKNIPAIEKFIKESNNLEELILYHSSDNVEPVKITTFLDLACQHALPEAIALLRQRGVDITKADEDGNTPLARALAKCVFDQETLLYLITQETINRPNKSGHAPLHIVLTQSYVYPSVIDLLYAQGAQFEGTDSAGNTPLHLAASRDTSGKLLKEMLKHFAPKEGQDQVMAEDQIYTLVNLKNKQGATPLHLAFARYLNPQKDKPNGTNTIEFLLRAGAELTEPNIEQVTPLDMVIRLLPTGDPSAQKLHAFLDETLCASKSPSLIDKFVKLFSI